LACLAAAVCKCKAAQQAAVDAGAVQLTELTLRGAAERAALMD
jgi:hypothetical protein